LGTYGCKAQEFIQYIKSIDPELLILNGDIFDIWQFSKHYFPKSHLLVVKYLLKLVMNGKKIFYVTGNHDEMLRKFVGLKIQNFEIVNKISFQIDGRKLWVFHGDVFDVVMQNSKWLAKLGGKGYDLLILINTFASWISERLGKGRLSFSKKIKNSFKSAVKHISNFENITAEIAIDQGFDYVICGHIHQPVIKQLHFNCKAVIYMNSGDWVENLTALEYSEGNWNLFQYMESAFANMQDQSFEMEQSDEILAKNTKDIFNQIQAEFHQKV